MEFGPRNQVFSPLIDLVSNQEMTPFRLKTWFLKHNVIQGEMDGVWT